MKAKGKFAAVLILFVSVAVALSSCSNDPEKAKGKYLALGEGYMRKGQYPAAAIEFRNALRLDPRFVEAYYQLAQADLAQHEWRAAYASLEKAVSLDPNRLDARLDRGRLYLASREFGKAEDEAQYILNQEPNNVGAFQLLGAALIGQQKFDQALTAFSKLVELRPNDPSAYVNLALVEISLQRLPGAEQHLKKAVAVDPKSVQASIDLANFYRLQNRLAESQQVLQEAVKNNPDGIPLYVEWASLLASQDKKDEAEALLQKLQQQLPHSADAAIAIGDFYTAHNKPDQALAEYRRAKTDAPKNLEIKKRLLDVYLFTNQTQLAADVDRELMKDAPKDVLVRVGHGRLLMAQGNSEEAISQLQRVVSDAVDSPQAHYFLGMAYWQSGKLTQASTEMQEALKVTTGPPMLPIVLEAVARVRLVLGDPSNAQTYAVELVQKFPGNAGYRQLLAEVSMQQHHLGEAEAQILIAKQLAPNDPIVHLSLAQIYSAEKKWPDAQKEFEAAIELDPHGTTTLGQYADFLVARGQSARATTLVQQYVSANPNNGNGHQILGTLYFGDKNYSAAQTEFERAIQLDPKNVQAYLRLGKVFEATGQLDTAIAQYQKALDLQPKHAPLATMVGNLYLQKDDLVNARKFYQQSLAADPNFAIANANMAWVDAQEGKNLDVALGMAQKAKSLMPDVPSITDTLGWVMYKRGNYESAVPLFQECVQKSPDSAKFRYHLGLTLVKAGQKAKGREQLEAALRMKLDPLDAQDARQVLNQVN